MLKKTATFPLPNISLKPATTWVKSIGVGAVIKPLPNDERWLQRHCVLPIFVFGPT